MPETIVIFGPGGLFEKFRYHVMFLKAMGFSKRTNGVMRIFTDQLNSHIAKQADRDNIPVLWWPSVGGGINGAKLEYAQSHYADNFSGNSNHVFCIITDKEPVQTFASRELTSKKGRRFSRIYKYRVIGRDILNSLTRAMAVSGGESCR